MKYSNKQESNKGKEELVHDDSIMPFGKWHGFRLGDVPDSYWQWFVEQHWAEESYPQLYRYAEIACDYYP